MKLRRLDLSVVENGCLMVSQEDIIKLIDKLKTKKCYCNKLKKDAGLCGNCIIENVKKDLKAKIEG